MNLFLTGCSWEKDLLKKGFSTSKKSLWIFEGLLMYFSREQASNVVKKAVEMAPKGSEFFIHIIRSSTWEIVNKSPSNSKPPFKFYCDEPSKKEQSSSTHSLLVTFVEQCGLKVKKIWSNWEEIAKQVNCPMGRIPKNQYQDAHGSVYILAMKE